MLSQAQLSAITDYLQTVPELTGCRIGHYGGTQSRVLHPGNPLSLNYSIIVIIDELNIRPVATMDPDHTPRLPSRSQVTNDSRVGSELIGAGLSCGLTVISGVGFVGALAAEGPSLGTSTVLAVAAWGGMLSGGAQCLNGIYRSYEAISNPQSDSLERLDNETWYSRTFLAIDAIGVLSGVAGMAGAGRSLLDLLERRAALPAAQQLERMTRAERNAVMRQALQRAVRAARDQRSRAELIAALQEAFPGRNIMAMLRGGGAAGTIRTGRIISNVISQSVARNITSELGNILLSLSGFFVSATPPSWTGSGSGALNALGTTVINVIQTDSE